MDTLPTAYQLTTSAAELNKIDKLRECGVSQYIGLPQLVVVGDQSSGKSSVLEALTQLPFPRNPNLCTTFPTQITFRNALQEKTVVTIIPSPSSDPERIAELRKYRKEYLQSVSGDEFAVILKDVSQVYKEAHRNDLSTFREDILKVELSGPRRENLSIIDTPGIFRRAVDGRTTDKDMTLVKAMVESYIKDKRTIILAVLPAGEDEENWEILSMAEKADSKGIRTLGVLTKPDLIDPGTEERVMSFVQGEKNPLKLGYYVLRNRGKLQESSSSEERDKAENEFFTQEPWSSLDRDHVGVHALKKRLQELLVDITRRELPNVRHQINARLDNCRKELKAMGADRKSTVQQQIYLQTMATNFQKITDHALDAYYARNPIFAEIPAKRLPTLVVDRSDKFAAELAKNGHTVEFDIDDNESGEDIGTTGRDGEKDESIRNSSDDEADVAATPSTESNAGRHKYPELSSLFPDEGDAPEPQHRRILDWIEHEYRKARGSGLQVISPSVLPTLWQQQSNNWRTMTRKYLADIIIYVHDFICKLMEHVCQEERTRSGLMAILLERFIDQYKVAIKHVEFLLEVELDGTPLTKNPSFQENLHKFRLERLGAAMSKSSIATDNLRDASGQEINGTVVRLEDVMLSGPMGDTEHAVNDIYCILKAYYEIARRRYVDAICTQGTDYHLLNGKNSPLRIFSSLFVASLTPEQLEEIAGEDASSKERRENLKREMDSLEEGKRLLSH
ncbi:uncharacterized protein K444DRAFT_706517 [Hyaloscypha bicolor E]|uniref:P-loop containing nucleoside triphosphate hydrolase protein n=1 Tax=Hyaloscypha bicolor E TaxID=1095630 RepID=A0A2J6SNR9_9HELO|nr:uncharacterized protein K444DRAFT_706517 [Hyaloscypha bicolor E]PMD52427.1 hypothetical protein K444DRAFT_706517 [Hyaloscypha bicolor E]